MAELLAISLFLLPVFLFAYSSLKNSVRFRLVKVEETGTQIFYFEGLDRRSVSPLFESTREAQL